jgi:hypothetical protein
LSQLKQDPPSLLDLSRRLPSQLAFRFTFCFTLFQNHLVKDRLLHIPDSSQEFGDLFPTESEAHQDGRRGPEQTGDFPGLAIDPFLHPANDFVRVHLLKVRDQRHRQGSQTAGQDRLDGLLPGPDDIVTKFEEIRASRKRTAVDARQVVAIRLRTKEDDDAPGRQVVTIVQQGIIAKKPSRKMGFMTGLQLDMREPGLRAGDPEDLVGLGGDGREVGVDDVHPFDRPETGERQPVGREPFHEEFRGRVVRLGHFSKILPPPGGKRGVDRIEANRPQSRSLWEGLSAGTRLTLPPVSSFERSRQRMPDRRVVIGLIVLAIAARAAAVLVLQSHKIPHSTYEHGEIAANLLAGKGFAVKFLGADGPTSQQAPAYPVLVAGAYAIGGIGTPRALLFLELGQAILGGVLVVFVLILASEVAPNRPRVAILAALIAAIHPTLVYSATHVQVASVASSLLTGCLAMAYRSGRSGSTLDALSGGILLGLLALSDPILALVAPGMAWAIVAGQPWQRSARLIGVIGLTAALCIIPWVIRNARVHGEFVPIKSSFGYAFWQGNCSMSEGTDKVVRPSVEKKLSRETSSLQDLNAKLWEARHEAGYLDDIALTPRDYAELGAVSEPERSRKLFRKALQDLQTDPGRYPRLCLRRLRYFVFFDETNPKTRSLIYRASHLGLTALAALGLMLARPEIRRKLGPTLLTAALIATFHALTIVSARFHLPIEPLMALWAACGAGGLQSFSDWSIADGSWSKKGILIDHRSSLIDHFRSIVGTLQSLWPAG